MPLNLDSLQLLLCEMQGRLFTLAAERGYDADRFVGCFMRSRAAAKLDAVFDRMQWLGEAYVLEEVVDEFALTPVANSPSVNSEALFWAGFIYRFWHFKTGEPSAEIYSQADADRVLGSFAGYHTISNDLAVENLKAESHARADAEIPRTSAV